ncbi:MAG: GC-type dockerin domain-anchored protein, partial [Planctomycetota bacterium]
DSSLITGVGIETVAAADLTVEIDGDAFSSLNSIHNTGSGVGNAGWTHAISVNNPSGPGLTLEDGTPVSIELVADVSIEVSFAGQIPLGNTYDTPGGLVISGDTFTFDVDVTQTTPSPLGLLTDTRLVFNRTGTIAGIATDDCPGDVNGDGDLNGSDFFAWVAAFGSLDPVADVNRDGSVDGSDFFAWVAAFGQGCDRRGPAHRKPKPRLHAHRAACRHLDYRAADRHPATLARLSPGDRAAGAVRFARAAARSRGQPVRAGFQRPAAAAQHGRRLAR